MDISLSVICPVYNEEKTLKIFYSNLKRSIDNCKKIKNYEIIFINNCSSDSTLKILKEFNDKDGVKVITFSRNFGYQASIRCGLEFANMDYVTFIDTDGEDPPEILIKLIEIINSENQIVYGERVDRHENLILKNLRKLYYVICKYSSDVSMVLNMSEFLIFHKKMKSYLINKNTNPFLRFEVANIGFKTIGYKYKRSKRIDGKSSYNIFGIIKFALNGYLTSSTFPLRVNSIISIITIIFCVFFVIIDFNLSKITVLLLMILVLFQSLQSLYLARIYRNTENRPIYIIDYENSLEINNEKN